MRDLVKARGVENVDKIFYNKAIKSIIPGADINKIPDAVIKWNDGSYTLVEVVSPARQL